MVDPLDHIRNFNSIGSPECIVGWILGRVMALKSRKENFQCLPSWHFRSNLSVPAQGHPEPWYKNHVESTGTFRVPQRTNLPPPRASTLSSPFCICYQINSQRISHSPCWKSRHDRSFGSKEELLLGVDASASLSFDSCGPFFSS